MYKYFNFLIASAIILLANHSVLAQNISLSQEGETPNSIMFVEPAEYDLITQWLTVRQNRDVPMETYLNEHLDRRKAEQLVARYNVHAGESELRAGCACVTVAPTTVVDNFPASNQEYLYESSPIRYKTQRLGASRSDYLRSLTAPNETGYAVYSGNTEASNSSSALRVTYVCTNGTGNIDNNCGCEKTMNIQAKYASRLIAVTSVGGVTGTRYAEAKAEDNMLLVSYNIDPNNTVANNLQVLEAGKALVDRSQRITTNPQFVVNMTNLVVSAITPFVTGGFTASTLTSIGNNIAIVLNTPINIQSGNVSSNGTTTAELSVLYDNGITLTPNIPKVIMLISKGNHFTKGKKGTWATYEARVEVNSGFSLAGVILFDNSPSICCVERTGVWDVAAYPLAPISETNFRLSAANYLSAHGAWNNLTTSGGIVSLPQNTGIATSTPQCAGCQTPSAFFTFGAPCAGENTYLDGTPSANETSYRVYIQSVNSSNVTDGFLNWNTPWINTTVGNVTLIPLPTHRYKITLEVMNGCNIVSYFQYADVIYGTPCMEAPPTSGDVEVRESSTKSATSNIINDSFTLKLYPNPASSTLTIDCTSPSEDEEVVVEIYTAAGQKVLDKQLSIGSTTIDISDLSNGIYLVKARQANGAESMKKLIVVK